MPGRRRAVLWALVMAGCSGGNGSSAPGLVQPRTSPAAGEWVEGDVQPVVTLPREVDPTSVSDRTIVLLDAAQARVPGALEIDRNAVRLRPDAVLAEGDYTLLFEREVRSVDGVAMALPAGPLDFSVHPRGSGWSFPPVELGGAGVDAPLYAADRIGGASMAWIHEGQLLVAEYDRNLGWRPATVVDRNVQSPTAQLHLARGAGTVLLVSAIPDAFTSGAVLLRAWISRRQNSGGIRIWDSLPGISANVAGALEVGVSNSGQPFLLLASRVQNTTALRVHWFDNGGQVEVLSGPAEVFALDGVYLGIRDDLAVAWTATDRSARSSVVRVRRRGAWEAAHELPGAPTDGGIGVDDNVWLLVPEAPARTFYLAQHDLTWGSETPSVPAGWAARRDRAGRLLVLDWRADGGTERLLAQRYDRGGQLVSEQVVAGPTPDALAAIALLGDIDTEMLAVWQQGQSIQHARYDASSGRWSAAAAWPRSFQPVPIERAVLTMAGARAWMTWLDGDRLVATHTTPYTRAPRPSTNERVSPSPTPLRDEFFYGTATGSLLAVWAQDGVLLGQDVRD